MSDSKNLERIANSLEEVAELLKAFLSSQQIAIPVSNPMVPPTPTKTTTTISVEEDFFLGVIMVYFKEEQNRRANGFKRKPSRVVSESLRATTAVFLSQNLPNLSVSNADGLVVFSRDNTPLAALKIYSDLGYHRGTHWHTAVSQTLQQASTKYAIPANRVFFLITSMVNGLDSRHVESLLGQTISNANLLNNRHLLETYLDSYISTLTMLPFPSKQVFLLAADIHPNPIATNWLNIGKQSIPNLTNYQWLRPSITELIRTLSSI